jgi:hypothetical protein
VLSQIHWKRILNQSLATFLVCVLFLTGCGGSQERSSKPPAQIAATRPTKLPSSLAEMAPPETLQALNQVLDRYQPQVKILSPQPGAVIESNQVSIQLQVKDLPIFKDADLGIGPHLDVVLDNSPSQMVYDLDQPLVFKDLAPGTHTLRVFASRPWHESFKNEGSFAQVTFHLFTPTTANNPSSSLPLLTYNAPAGTIGAEPVLLDFYLSNAPLRLATGSQLVEGTHDWRIRCTVNGQSFTLDRWQPLYLTGFQPGKNWVRLELINAQGQLIDNAFNDVIQVVDYQPNGQDTVSKLLRGDIKLAKAKSMILPGFKAIEEPEATPEVPVPVVEAIPTVPEPVETPAIAPLPIETPEAVITPEPIATPGLLPESSLTPQAEEQPKPVIAPQKKGWGGFFSRSSTPNVPAVFEPTPTAEPTAEPIEKPQTSVEITPETPATPEAVPAPESESTPAKKGWGSFFSRSSAPNLPTIAEPTPTTEPTAEPALAEEQKASVEVTPDPVTPPEAVLTPAKKSWGSFFSRSGVKVAPGSDAESRPTTESNNNSDEESSVSGGATPGLTAPEMPSVPPSEPSPELTSSGSSLNSLIGGSSSSSEPTNATQPQPFGRVVRRRSPAMPVPTEKPEASLSDH